VHRIVKISYAAGDAATEEIRPIGAWPHKRLQKSGDLYADSKDNSMQDIAANKVDNLLCLSGSRVSNKSPMARDAHVPNSCK